MRFRKNARPGRGTVLASVAIIGFTLLATLGIFALVDEQREFELSRWQARLETVSGGGARMAEDFAAEGSSALAKAAANPTVQIYLTELEAAGFEPSRVDQGEIKKSFVTAYVASLGQREPFARGGAGIALIAADGSMVAATPDFLPSPDLLAAMREAVAGPRATTMGEESAILFAAPVKPIQAADPQAAPAGYFIGLRTIDARFQARFAELGGAEMAVALIALQGETPVLLSPPARANMEMATATNLAAAAAAPGRLHRVASGGEAMLVLGQTVTGTPLIVVAHVAAETALAGVDERLGNLLLSLMLGLIAVIAAVFALSRHLEGTRAAEEARAAERHASELAERERLLRSVADTHPGGLALIGSDGRIVFANSHLASMAGIAPEALAGQPLGEILPPPVLGASSIALARCQEEEKATSGGEALLENGHTLSVTAVPLVGAGEMPGGALLSLDDITGAVDRRDRKIAFHWALTDLLLEAIDQRDPGAAAHSRRAAALAAALAEALGAAPDEIETAKLSAALLNAGKLFVPSELLTKREALTSDERRQIVAGSERWIALLARTSAELPLAAVLKEAFELMSRLSDTSADTDITARREAKIVVVANSFVAMVSPRAYRMGKTPSQALEELAASPIMDRSLIALLGTFDLTEWMNLPATDSRAMPEI